MRIDVFGSIIETFIGAHLLLILCHLRLESFEFPDLWLDRFIIEENTAFGSSIFALYNSSRHVSDDLCQFAFLIPVTLLRHGHEGEGKNSKTAKA